MLVVVANSGQSQDATDIEEREQIMKESREVLYPIAIIIILGITLAWLLVEAYTGNLKVEYYPYYSAILTMLMIVSLVMFYQLRRSKY